MKGIENIPRRDRILIAACILACVIFGVYFFAESQKLSDIVNLRDKEIVAKDYTVNLPPNTYYWWNFSVNYAGFILIKVESSTINNTIVEIDLNSQYSSQTYVKNLGDSGIYSVPVLPGNVVVKIYNRNPYQSASITVSIEYHY